MATKRFAKNPPPPEIPEPAPPAVAVGRKIEPTMLVRITGPAEIGGTIAAIGSTAHLPRRSAQFLIEAGAAELVQGEVE